ncbi:MAG: tetraacyldisaccharide 4'-kinase [Acidobacteria bacterium]|nr:tetraacyldisaccharide 4'-kinase [Acidobacteriota bacterium]
MNPLSALYGAGIGLRNRLFDRGVLPAMRLEQPVVSVGNLSTGGAGKTPFVIALGELLKERGVSFDVLSRGYGRKTRGVRIVDPRGSASDFGDEPLLIARKLGAPVVVGESRYEAGRLAEQKFQAQLHLLDDGLQHRSLARDFDIVLMTEADLQDALLPIGRLREPMSALRRADAILLPQGLAVESARIHEKPVWRVTRELVLAEAPASPIVFCGLARPEQFFAQVRECGVAPAAEVAFRDHHAYADREIQSLLTMKSKLGAQGFVTTEKDGINLGALRSQLEPLVVATLKLTIDHPVTLVDTILARIAERKPRS